MLCRRWARQCKWQPGSSSTNSSGGGDSSSTLSRDAEVSPILHCAVAGADTALVPFYAIYASLWAVYFFKYWRRYQAALEFRWDVSDFAAEEPTRLAFHRHPATKHDRTGFYAKDAGFMPFGARRGDRTHASTAAAA